MVDWRCTKPNWNKHPDGPVGWLMVTAAFTFYFAAAIPEHCFGVVYLDIADTFQASISTTGWIISIFTFCYFVTGIFVAPLVRKYGSRPLAIVGSLVAFVATLGSSFGRELYQMYLTAVIAGCATGIFKLLAQVLVNQFFVVHQGKATLFALLGSGLGALYASLHAYLSDIYGWRGAAWIQAGFILQTLPFAVLCRAPPRAREAIADVTMSATGRSGKRDLYGNKRFWLYLVGRSLHVTLTLANVVHFFNHARLNGITTNQISTMISMAAPSVIVMQLVTSVIVDKPFVNRFWLMTGVCLVLSVLLLLIPFTASYVLLSALNIAFKGLSTGVGMGISNSLLVKIVGVSHIPYGEGTVNFIAGVLMLLLVPFLGWLAVVFVGYKEVYFTMAAIMLFTTLAFLLLAIHQPRDSSHNNIKLSIDLSPKEILCDRVEMKQSF